MTFLKQKKGIAALVAVAVVAVGAMGAFAYWTTSGSGTGSVATGTTAGITVNETSASTNLFPGGSKSLSGNFDNGNSFPVFVTAVTASVTAFTAQADNTKPACTAADFNVTGTATVGAQVPSGSGQGSWSGLTLNMVNSGANQDNCKGITVPLTLASS